MLPSERLGGRDALDEIRPVTGQIADWIPDFVDQNSVRYVQCLAEREWPVAIDKQALCQP